MSGDLGIQKQCDSFGGEAKSIGIVERWEEEEGSGVLSHRRSGVFVQFIGEDPERLKVGEVL